MFGTIIVVNKTWRDQPGTLASAIGHVSLSIAAQTSDRKEIDRVDYLDADQNTYPGMSKEPVLVMAGQAGKIWSLWDLLEQQDLPRAAYLDTMISGGSDAQVQATAIAARSDLTPIVVATFCERDAIAHATRRFSLYR